MQSSLTMSSEEALFEENSTQKCGEIFYSIMGNFIFHCTLCEKNFDSFQDYSDHIEEQHLVNHSENHEDETFSIESITPTSPANTIQSEVEIDGSALDGDEFPIVELRKPSLLSVLPDKCDKTREEKKNDHEKRRSSLLSEFGNRNIEVVTEIEKVNSSNTKKFSEDWRKSYKVVKFFHKDDSTGEVTERQRYECNACGIVIKDKSNVVSHLRRHFDEKRHKCPECDNSYHKPSELRAHRRRHQGEKLFLCNDCGISFYTSGQLRLHVERHLKLKTKECHICHLKFYSNQIKRHMLVHTDERPSKCTTCSAAFKCRKSLKVHMRIHDNNRRYKCDLCSDSFNYRISLNNHLRNKHVPI